MELQHRAHHPSPSPSSAAQRQHRRQFASRGWCTRRSRWPRWLWTPTQKIATTGATPTRRRSSPRSGGSACCSRSWRTSRRPASCAASRRTRCAGTAGGGAPAAVLVRALPELHASAARRLRAGRCWSRRRRTHGRRRGRSRAAVAAGHRPPRLLQLLWRLVPARCGWPMARARAAAAGARHAPARAASRRILWLTRPPRRREGAGSWSRSHTPGSDAQRVVWRNQPQAGRQSECIQAKSGHARRARTPPRSARRPRLTAPRARRQKS